MLTGVNHITLAVTDIQRSFQFYHEVLGLTPLCKWDQGAYFLCGDFWFCLNVDKTYKPAFGYTHYAFSVKEEDFKEMSQRIQDANAAVFKENTSPGDSLYFLDPDGHKLEIHVGSWQERVKAKKEQPGSWNDVKWYV